ncbi:efflux RND transporter periplasmic adaptor subunit [Corallococcus soli]
MSRSLIIGTTITLSAAVALLVGVRHSAARQLPVGIPSAPPSLLEEPVAKSREAASFVGVVVASSSVDISARFEGRLDSVDVQVGDRVRKGQVLARMDVLPLLREMAVTETDLQAALAQESVARLALAAAQESLKRGGDPKLLSIGAISEEEQARLGYAEKTAAAQLTLALAQVRNGQARLAQFKLKLSEAVIQAPFEGRIAKRYLDAGSLVSAGKTILHLLHEGPSQIRFAIPESQASLVAVGASVQIRSRGDGPRFSGRVENVAPEVDSVSRMVLAIARLPADAANPFPLGAAVRVSVVGVGAQGASAN